MHMLRACSARSAVDLGEATRPGCNAACRFQAAGPTGQLIHGQSAWLGLGLGLG